MDKPKRIVINNTNIEYLLIRKNVKNINLRINRDSSVVVSANKKVPEAFINKFVNSKAEWIISNQKALLLKQDSVKQKEYRNGDTICIFGKEKLIEIKKGRRNRVCIENDTFMIEVKDPNDIKSINQTIIKTNRELLLEIVEKSVMEHKEIIGLSFFPQIKIRKMISKWGTCAIKKRVITINYYLVHHAKAQINYIVLHELLHYFHRGHGREFYGAMDHYMPEWKFIKKEMKGFDYN